MNKKEFLNLLDKYLAGEASLTDEQLLFKVYESFQDQQEWNADELAAISLLENKLFEKIKLAIDEPKEPPVHQVKYLYARKLMIAASVAAFLIIGFKYFLKPQQINKATLSYNRKKQPILKNDFKAGGNSAYLILANGKSVALNQAKIGLLAQQGGNTVVKQRDGKIIYNQTSAAPSLKDTMTFNKIVVPVGGQYTVTLSDGTNVWLNSSSSLEYPVQFSGKQRQIKLTGEAYFEVSKNKNMPFVVTVNSKMNVRVYGTHFNIMAYNDEKEIRTTLLEGSVKIEDFLDPANNTYLVPGQQADFLNSNGGIKVKEADMDEAIAWKEGRFLFNNENIHSIMRKLSRWYNVDVVFSDDMKNKSFDGSISKYKNISEVLKLMELTKSVQFKFEGRRILVMP